MSSYLLVVEEVTQIGADVFALDQSLEVGRLGDTSFLHKDVAFTNVAHDIQVHRFIWMQAQKDQPSFRLQLGEKVEHETDIAVLGVELGLVEEMDHRIVDAGPLHQEVGFQGREMAHLIGLVIVNGEPVTLIGAISVWPPSKCLKSIN